MSQLFFTKLQLMLKCERKGALPTLRRMYIAEAAKEMLQSGSKTLQTIIIFLYLFCFVLEQRERSFDLAQEYQFRSNCGIDSLVAT